MIILREKFQAGDLFQYDYGKINKFQSIEL